MTITNRLITLILLLIALSTGIYWIKKHSDSTASIVIDSAFNKKNIIPVCVIGSGPAGLSAALYGARSSLYTVVFQGKVPGGQLTTTTYVENWPGTKKLLGSELIDQNRKQAEQFGAIMVNDIIDSVDFSKWPYKLVTQEGHEINALSVIIATGATPKKLLVPGEDKYFGKGGITTCAVCDAPFYKGKNVVVVGGGDSAIEEAVLLTSYADKVTMLVRGVAMRAAPAMQKRLQGSKIKVIYNTKITQIFGDGNNVNEIELLNSKTNQISKMKIDGIFLAVGHEANTKIFKNRIALDAAGYIEVAPHTQKTSVKGVFAAGDVSDHRYRQAGVAAGDGIKAALDAVAFLQDIGFNDEAARKLETNYYDPFQDIQPLQLPRVITTADVDKYLSSKEPVVIKVGASYCPPCKALMPIFESVAAKLESKVHFIQIDLDDNPKELVKRFEIKEIPTMLIFKNKKLLYRGDEKSISKRELYALISNMIQESNK